jgi:hypothetical protein
MVPHSQNRLLHQIFGVLAVLAPAASEKKQARAV